MPGDDKKWKEIYKRAKETGSTRARVGVLASKGGGAIAEGSDITLVELAAIHEFGTADGHVPERAFLRATFLVRSADALKKMVADITKAILAGKIDVKQGINMLGSWGAAQVKDLISSNEADQYGPFPYPPNADSTIAAKGSSVPLIGKNGQLFKAITWEVVESDEK